MNGMSGYATGIKVEDGENYSFNAYPEADEVTAWHHAHYYLKQMSIASQDRSSLATVAARTETRGLVITIRNMLLNERWELGILLFRSR